MARCIKLMPLGFELNRGQVFQGGVHALAHVHILQKLTDLLVGLIIVFVIGEVHLLFFDAAHQALRIPILGGLPGWLLSAAIASSTTVVMGYAAVRWFEKGERLSTEALKQLTQSMTSYLLDALKSLGKRKPGQKGLRERIIQTLESSPLAESRSALDNEAGEENISQ